MMGQRLSNREIAERLFLSEGSVKQYVNQIYSKLHIDGDTRTKRTRLTELLANLGGFAVYLLLFSRLSRFLILLVVLTAAADFFVSHYISEWEYRHRDEREQYDKELHYFLTQPRQIHRSMLSLCSWLHWVRMPVTHDAAPLTAVK